MTTTRVSGSSGALARIAAIALGSKSKAEEDDEKKKDAKKKKASDKDDDGSDNDEMEGEDKKDDADAEDKKDDDKAEDGDDEEESAAKDEDHDDDDEDGEPDKKGKKKTEHSARMNERARIRKIIGHQFALASDQHRVSAYYFAFETNMSANAVIGILAGLPVVEGKQESKQSQKTTQASARERMETTPNPKVKSDASGSTGGPSLAQQIVAAGKKRRGEVE